MGITAGQGISTLLATLARTVHSRVFRPQLWLVSSSVHGERTDRPAGTPDVRILQ